MKKHLKNILILILSVFCITAIALFAGCTTGGGNDDTGGNEPHKHSYTSVVTPPTCTKAGSTTYTCACGESYVDDYVNATGHTPKTAVHENEVAASCQHGGSYDIVVRCSVCNEVITSTHETTESTGHYYTNGICSVCGDGNGTLYDLSEIMLNNTTVTYNGTAQYIKIDGTLPNGLSVVYDNNGKTNAGNYTVTAKITDGKDVYKMLTAKLTIEKRELNITFSGNTNLLYNGQAQKTITATAVNLVGTDTVDITISYSGAMIDEGIYIATATIAENDNYVLTQNNTVTVTIARAVHTVTFKQQGQPDIVRTVVALGNLAQELIPTPASITGYTVAWEDKDLTAITEDIVINAIKTPIEYHITYVLNGGENHKDNPETFTIETPMFYLGDPTKAASSFSGWYTTSNFLMDSRILLIESGSHSDITLYANWLEFRITSAIGFNIDMKQEPPLVYRDVSNTTQNIDLNDKISVSLGCTWSLYRDFEGFNELKLKAMSLEIGHNYAYIIVYHPDGIHFSRYKLDIYRLDMKKYTFIDGAFTDDYLEIILGNLAGDTALENLLPSIGGSVWASGTIQEKSELAAPENPSRPYYSFAGWVTGSNTPVSFPYQILTDTTFFSKYTPIEYEIFYHANGGVITTVKNSYNVLSPFVVLDIPVKTGYDFAGWYMTEDFSGYPLSGITSGTHGDIDLYAKWTPHVYDIVYHLNDGELSAENPETYTIETPEIVFSTATRTAYTFGGWYSDTEFSVLLNSLPLGSYGDLNLYAKWNPIVYPITYVLNGGTLKTEVNDYHADKSVTFDEAEKDYYDFAGWFDNAELDGEAVTGIPEGNYGDKTFYAKWTLHAYNIIYYLNNGKNSAENPDTYTIETPEITFKEATRIASTFDGWYSDAELTVPLNTVPLGSYGDLNVYAKWIPTVYKITYILNDGTLETDKNDYHIEKSVIFDTPEKNYYDFVGWYDNAELNGEAVTGIPEGNYGNKTFYAKWTPTVYTITYELNGGTLQTEVNGYHIEKSVTFDAPEKNYYDFKGWFDNAQFNGEAITGIEVGNHGNKTFYAKWTPTVYTITYELNNGSLETDKNSYTVEMKLSLDTPVKEYYDFVGWCEKEDLSDTAIAELSVGNHGNKTFYAKFVLHEYKITYILDGGTALGELRTTFTVEDLPLELNLGTPYKDNYFFEGWYSDASFNNPLTQFTQVGDKTVYVKWLVWEDYFTFSLSSDSQSYTVTGYSGSFIDIAIPSEYLNKPVTAIGSSAFKNCSSLTSITIPDSVTSIGSSAFSGCSSLESITLPFVGNALTGTSNTHFGYIFGASSYSNNANYVPQSLKTVIITGGSSIGSSAFAGCSSLMSVTIGNSVEDINAGVFRDCSSLTSITIPDSVTYIGSYAFRDCSSLETVYWNAINCTRVGPSSSPIFTDCTRLTNVIIGENVKTIPSYAFEGCSNLEHNEYSNALYLGNSINPYVVLVKAKSTSITECTIHDDTKVIYHQAFEYCSSLTSITIPDSVTSIGSSAFYGCNGLTSVYYTGDITSWCGISGLSGLMGYGSSNKKLYLNGEELTGELIIPDSVTAIPSSAFDGCSSLTSITIPNSVTSIGSSAFAGCSSLTSITIPNSVTSIGERAFQGCSSITSITIPDSVTAIPSYAFAYCSSLTSITIPNSVTSIGERAFQGCYRLVEIYNLSTLDIVKGATSHGSVAYYAKAVYTSIEEQSKLATASDGYIFYDDGEEVYLIGYTGTQTQLQLPDDFNGKAYAINSSAFYGCSKLTSITIPNSVTSIGSSAFSGCSSLTSITIPNSVTSIGESAFYNCSSLTSVYWNATKCSSAGSSSYPIFNGCTGLTNVVIGENVKTIPSYAFYGRSKLTSITIPNSVTSIGSYAFENCSSLTSVTIGNSVTSIGNSAFMNCSKLTSITIPNSVTSIGNYAFAGCSKLTKINYGGTNTQWNSIKKGSDWNYNTAYYTVYCSNGNITKS